MCGIVAVTGYKKALPLLMNGLEKLEYRGYDSAGIAIINSETNCISCNKAEGKLKNLKSNKLSPYFLMSHHLNKP